MAKLYFHYVDNLKLSTFFEIKNQFIISLIINHLHLKHKYNYDVVVP